MTSHQSSFAEGSIPQIDALRSMGKTAWLGAGLLTLIVVTTTVADGPRCDSWVDVYRGEPMKYDEVLQDLLTVRIVFVGECHALERHHLVQEALVRDLASADRPLVLGLEQMEHFQQPHLDDYNAGEISFDELAQATQWSDRWRNYEDYRGILETARKNDIPILALNARRETIRDVARKGGIEGLTAEQRAELPEDLWFDEPAYQQLLNLQLMVHMTMTEERLRPVREAQMCRDAMMAAVLTSYLTSPEGQGRRAIVLCGNGHVAYGLGTVSRVRRRLPEVTDRIIILSQSGDLELTPEEKAMARDIEISHEQLREIQRPVGDYLHMRSLAPN